MTQIQTILFDLDGTLIDSEPAAARAIREAFEKWNILLSHEDAHYITGRTWAAGLTYLFGKYSPPVAQAQASQQIQDRYHQILQEGLPMVPGAIDAVRDLAKEFTLGLVSGSLRHEILWALGRIGIADAFRFIIGGDEYPRSKPAPDGYLRALEALSAKPESTLIFEDSTAGVASALACGAWCVAITGTHVLPQEIAGSHIQIPHLQMVNRRWVHEIAQKHLKPKTTQG